VVVWCVVWWGWFRQVHSAKSGIPMVASQVLEAPKTVSQNLYQGRKKGAESVLLLILGTPLVCRGSVDSHVA
jgi:hypothetical protein